MTVRGNLNSLILHYHQAKGQGEQVFVLSFCCFGGEKMLKPKQLQAIDYMVFEPQMSYAQIAEAVGVNKKTFWQWRQSNEFMEHYHKICESNFRKLESLAIAKLEENTRKGNQKAIEYILDYMGYKAVQKVEADINTDIVINIDGTD